MDVIYFGCIGVAGHRCFGESKSFSERDLPYDLISNHSMDGPYCPGVTWDRRDGYRPYLLMPDDQPEGAAALHHVGNWTVLAFWDRSIDHRRGSHSTFALRGTHDFAEAVRLARGAFPNVWKRYGFEVALGSVGKQG